MRRDAKLMRDFQFDDVNVGDSKRRESSIGACVRT